MRLRSLPTWLLLAPFLTAAAQAQAQIQPEAASRGELLYNTHCIGCHDTQVHWRDAKRAQDFKTLEAEVRRWQEIGRLNWERADLDEVTRYLNRAIYRYPQPPVAGR